MTDEFGKALWELLTKGKTKFHSIIRRNDGIIEVRDLKKYLESYNKFPDFQKKALKHAKGKVLDIGCGGGKHSLYLQEKGLDVLGIDNSKGCLKVCKKRGLKKTKLGDFKKIKFGKEKFDTLLILGSGVALASSDGGLINFLKKMNGITSEDAVILMDSTNIKKAKRGIFHYTKKGHFQIRFESNGKMGNWFTPKFISDNQIRKIIKKTSWKIKRIYLSKGGDQYSVVLVKR